MKLNLHQSVIFYYVSNGKKALSLEITKILSVENDQNFPTFGKMNPISRKKSKIE